MRLIMTDVLRFCFCNICPFCKTSSPPPVVVRNRMELWKIERDQMNLGLRYGRIAHRLVVSKAFAIEFLEPGVRSNARRLEFVGHDTARRLIGKRSRT